MFFNVVCIIWKLKCWILLMHGVTMKLIDKHIYIDVLSLMTKGPTSLKKNVVE